MSARTRRTTSSWQSPETSSRWASLRLFHRFYYFRPFHFVLSIVICWTISCDFSFFPVPRSLCSPSRPPDLLTDSSFVEQACTEELSRTAAKLIENQECFKTMLEEHEPEVRSMVEATTAKAI